MAIDHELRTVGLPALQLWDVLLQRPTKLHLHEDNAACIRVMETGRNPTMRHLGRTHRIDVAWTAERIQGPDVELIKTDTKIMAADIHTKPFPDALRSDWERDLRLINIVDPDKFFVAPKPETASVSKAYDDDEKLAGGCADAASAADTNDADLDELSDDDDTDEDWEVTPLSKDDMEFDCPEWSPCQSSDYDYGVLYACPAYPRDTAPVAEDTLFAIPGIPKTSNRVLFEFCADPDSMLGQLKSKSRNGCVVIRATEYHDMSSQKGIEWALKVIDSIPKHCKIMLWSAIPCTGGCPWASINKKYPSAMAKLKRHRALFDKLWENFKKLADAVALRDGVISMEWPPRCAYWHDRRVLKFLKTQMANCTTTVVDSCMHGLRSKNPCTLGERLHKKWKVVSTTPCLHKYLCVPCSGDHSHVPVSADDSKLSGYYPVSVAEGIHHGFKDATTNNNESTIRRDVCACAPTAGNMADGTPCVGQMADDNNPCDEMPGTATVPALCAVSLETATEQCD